MSLPVSVEEFIKNWPSPIVARRDFPKFSGGLYSVKSMGNMDSQGIGPANRIRVGGTQVAYPTRDAAEWIVSRMQAIQGRKGVTA